MVEPVVLIKILEFFRAAEVSLHNTIKRKKLYDPFLWMGLNCLKATEQLQGGSLP